MHDEKVSGSELPESPELRRTAFRPDPEDTSRMDEQLCERWRAAATGGDRHVVRHGHNGPGRRPGGVEGRSLRPVREARQVRGRAEGRVGGQGPGRKSGIRHFRLAEGRPGPRQVEETNMTVNELVQELQRPDRPDLDVFIPCPHCCGQRGARLRPAGRGTRSPDGTGRTAGGPAGRHAPAVPRGQEKRQPDTSPDCCCRARL